MLVLTRRLGETIVIGNNIRLTVVSIGPGRVKLGIEAPADVRIDRQEIHERIVEEKAGTPSANAAERPQEPILVGDDAPKIHNRIADKLPVEEVATSAVDRFRRKPR